MRLPWQDRDRPADSDAEPDVAPPDGDPVLSCTFQDGTLAVYEEAIHIERSPRSNFADKSIPMDEVRDVTYAKRLVISYVQIEQLGFENSEGSLLTTPVGENTLHFGRGKRRCARRARDAIFERMGIQ